MWCTHVQSPLDYFLVEPQTEAGVEGSSWHSGLPMIWTKDGHGSQFGGSRPFIHMARQVLSPTSLDGSATHKLAPIPRLLLYSCSTSLQPEHGLPCPGSLADHPLRKGRANWPNSQREERSLMEEWVIG